MKTRASASQERNWNLSALPSFVVLIILVVFALAPLYALVLGPGVWNECLFAQTFMPRPELNTVATSLAAFQQRGGRQWGLTNAASVIMITPVIVLFLALQRRFIHGLTQGGLKA